MAEVEGEPSEEALVRSREGVELDDGPTAPAQARRLGAGRIELSLHEGRKHQVKRMLAAVGHPVSRLHRSRYAGLTLEGLEPGAWRELEPSEVDQLRTRRPAPLPGRSGRSRPVVQSLSWFSLNVTLLNAAWLSPS